MSNPGIIFPHQSATFREILAAARTFACENWWALPIIPRWHFLIVAPTGVGKSHLISAVGKALDWPVYSLFVSRWIIAGGRGRETMQAIAQWLSQQNTKCLIFIDEIDKISGEDTWSRHLRTEVYQLLDRDLPAEIEIDDSDSEHSKGVLWGRARMNLRCHTMIISAGAFQRLWDHRPKTLGFSAAAAASETIPSQQEMKMILPAELINRYGKILAMQPLVGADYIAMIEKTSQVLPAEIRKNFLKIANKNLSSAIEEGKGTRYVEECITQVLLIDSELKLDRNKGKEVNCL